jgi:UDP-N-acetylglucosamine--N-acetylmuramyl-(pentapeptide) pyrophosphoryl-undecaprenol N-acetylglucosamine transferase
LTWKNVLFPIKVVHSLLKCRSIIREFKPDAVVGVGGYASGPLVRTATGKGIPTVLLEQNSYPGMTNRMLAKKADKICVAYPGMQKYFPQEKIILTGNPIRASLGQSVSRQEAARVFGLDPQKKTILAMGGSLGARTINETITQSYDLIADRYDIQVLWQIGKLYATHYLDTPVAKLDHVRASVYIDRMDMAYAIADVVVARAGAMTISELCLTGKASILVPSPYVAEDHQTHNARSLVQEGAAILIPDSDAPREVIPAALRLLSQPDEILRMESQIRKLGKPQAADDIAGIIIRLANSTQQS